MASSRRMITFSVDKRWYGLDVELIKEVLPTQAMTRVALANDEVCGLLNLRGQIITAIDLRKRLGLPARPESTPLMHVVVNCAGDPLDLVVDEVGEVREVADADFEAPPATLHDADQELITGCYKLPDLLLLTLAVDRAFGIESFDVSSGTRRVQEMNRTKEALLR